MNDKQRANVQKLLAVLEATPKEKLACSQYYEKRAGGQVCHCALGHAIALVEPDAFNDPDLVKWNGSGIWGLWTTTKYGEVLDKYFGLSEEEWSSIQNASDHCSNPGDHRTDAEREREYQKMLHVLRTALGVAV